MNKRIPPLLLVILAVACAPILPSTSTSSTDIPSPPPVVTAFTQTETVIPPTATQITSPFSPDPNDVNLQRGEVFIKEAGATLRETSPVLVVLTLSGDLPTPCHQLRVSIASPDLDNMIRIDAYTVVDPGMICTQVLKPFQEMIELGSFPPGHYTVWVNDSQVGEFDA